MNRVFTDIKDELKKGRMVLFTGTPCQNAGLSAYLRKSYENLYLCDIVCHGVPSPVIFEDYKRVLQDKYQSKIELFTFRFKPSGWRSQAIGIKFVNQKEYVSSAEIDAFYRLFLRNIILRASCYDCRFTNLTRPSDITIGDFWGIEESIPDFEDNLGVSLVLINSPKGSDLSEKISSNLYFRASNPVDCLQRNLYAPSEPSPQREQFWRDYWERGFEYALKKYTTDSFWIRAKTNAIKPILEKMGLLDMARQVLRK